jgi:hypothetical protein
VEVPFEAKPLDMFLYWHKAADDDPANRWLRGRIHQSIAADLHNKSRPDEDDIRLLPSNRFDVSVRKDPFGLI